jgi:hypothetical protein
MWALDNRTPYAAERNWIRDKDGRHQWIVAIKVTFDVAAAGTLSLADEQVPPTLQPEFFGDPGQSSLRYETDLGPLKPATDVVVNGHAHAPDDRPTPELAIALRVGNIRKVLSVRGPCVYRSGAMGWTTTAPLPFVRMPLQYEHAFGGSALSDPDPSRQAYDERNPVGVGVVAQGTSLEGTPAPNLVYPGRDAQKAGPAGLGAIASHWSPRLALAGTYDAAWIRDRKPLLPVDYDPSFALCSPVDQRNVGYLRGGMPVELVHCSPGGVFRFELPKIWLALRTQFGARNVEHRTRMVTVVLEPDDAKVMVVYQSQLPVSASDIDYLDITRIEEKRYIS